MSKDVRLMKVGKALSDYAEKNSLIPRLLASDEIWMMKVDGKYKPVMKLLKN